jgi:hypothetical protein
MEVVCGLPRFPNHITAVEPPRPCLSPIHRMLIGGHRRQYIHYLATLIRLCDGPLSPALIFTELQTAHIKVQCGSDLDIVHCSESSKGQLTIL